MRFLVACTVFSISLVTAGAIGGGAIGGGSLGAGERAMGEQPGGTVTSSVVYLDHTFSPASLLPTCTSAAGCVLQCHANSTGGWVCVDGDGASVTVQDGSGYEYAATPWDRTVRLDVDNDTSAPTITGADADAFRNVYAGDHTVLLTGYGTTLENATYQYAFSHEAGNGGLGIRQEGTLRCIWGTGSTSVAVVANGGFQHGMSMLTCRKTGTTTNRVGVSGNYAQSGNFSGAAPTAGTTMYFGRRSGTFPLRGPLDSFTLYDEYKTDAFVDEQTGKWASLTIGSSVATWTPLAGSGTALVGKLDSAGYFIPVTASLPRVGPNGLVIEGGSRNLWGTDPLDADAATDIGTPTFTANAASGPFSRYRTTAEADLMVDDDAAAFEGIRSASAGTAAGYYTVSAMLAVGTSGTVTDKARLSITTDGTGSTDCDVDLQDDCRALDLAGWYRCECTGTVGGSPTYVYGDVTVGNQASDTGSLLVSFLQVEAKGWATEPRFAFGTNVGEDRVNIPQAELDTWFGGDWTAGGEITIVWQTFHDDSVRDATAADANAQYLIDVNDGAGHAFLPYRLRNSSGACTADHWCVQMFDSSGCSAADYTLISDSTASIAAHTWYVIRVKWAPTGPGLQEGWLYFDTCADPDTCEATTLIGHETDQCQTDVTPTVVNLGRRFSNTRYLDGQIYRLKVSG